MDSITRGPTKSDQGLGLGDDDVAHKGKTSAHAAHGGVGQHADEGQAFLARRVSAALVLAICMSDSSPSRMRAARGGKAQEGYLLIDGGFDAAHKALAHHAAHAAAHEVKFEAGRHQVDAFDRTAHDDEGVGLARVFQGFLQALGVLAAVLNLSASTGSTSWPIS